MTDELDRDLLEIGSVVARRTLELIDQGKIPGYRRCTGYEDGNPERRDMGPLGGQAPAKASGLYNKYRVTRADGREDPDAEYIVLRVDAKAKDREAALLGVRAYARAIKGSCPDLAADLYRRYGQGAGPGMEGMEQDLLTTEGMDSLIGRGLSDLVGREQSLDDEMWMIYIGAALGLIPHGLRDWKALIYESPAICEVLHDILQLLIERRVLLSGTLAGEKVYRLPDPRERWEVDLPDMKGVRRLLIGEELMQSVERDGFFYAYEGMAGRRLTVKAEPAYPVLPEAPGSRPIQKVREQMIDQLTAKLRSLSVFVRQHAEMMRLLFELGGCKRPEEAVCSLIFEDYETPKSVPVAYTQKLEHEGDEYDGFGRR